MNLWKETNEILKVHDKKWEYVRAVAALESAVRIPLDVFERIAKETDYDNGFGGQEVATDLCVVGNGFWMNRGEYDGSEWWDYHEYPDISGFKEAPDIFTLADTGRGRYGTGGVWGTVAQKNWPDQDQEES